MFPLLHDLETQEFPGCQNITQGACVQILHYLLFAHPVWGYSCDPDFPAVDKRLAQQIAARDIVDCTNCSPAFRLPKMGLGVTTAIASLVVAFSIVLPASGQFSSTLTCQPGASGSDVIQLCTGAGTLALGDQV